MYWICVGDSAKGTLALARPAIEPGLPLDHMIALCDDYSRGDISDVTDERARGEIVFPPDWRAEMGMEEGIHALARQFEQALPSLERMEGEAVVWYGSGAVDICGMLYIVSRLHARDILVTLVCVDRMPYAEMPAPEPFDRRADVLGGTVGIVTDSKAANAVLRYVPQKLLRWMVEHRRRREWENRPDRGEVRFNSVGELDPGYVPWFYARRRTIPACERALLAARWDQLVRENAPLRVLEEGKPVSAAVDHYDDLILDGVSEEEKPAAFAVGRALGTIQGVSDSFVFARIRALGEGGRLEIVKDAPNYREMIIRAVKRA